MNKELTPLEAFECIIVDLTPHLQEANKEEIKIVTNALKEHELMKEIRITARFDLAQVNKEHKALEIIKENCEFDFLERKINDMPTRYEIHIRPKNKEQLLFTCFAIFVETKEEYDLLKEVLL